MKLRTASGHQAVFGPGDVIGFQRVGCCFLVQQGGTGEYYQWWDGRNIYRDRSLSCLVLEEDFREVVQLFSEMMGLMAVPVDRPYGPAFCLEKPVKECEEP